MRRRLLCVGLSVGTALRAERAPVRLPAPPLGHSSAPSFQHELLQLALRKAGWSAEVEVLPPQTWKRQVLELRAGYADVSPLPALQTQLYASYGLLRVDFALRGGLLGLRRLVALTRMAGPLSRVTDLASLQRDYRLGYGSDWGDLPLMRRLGFRVQTATGHEALYGLLREGRADFLSRGLGEVAAELARFGDTPPRIDAVPGLALVYPLDDCFFVAPQRRDLHAALHRGLQRAQQDGSFLALLLQHHGQALSALRGARILTLKGYPSPDGLPPAQLETWREALDNLPASATRAPAKPPTLRVAAGQTADDPRFQYAARLLNLALRKAGREFELLPVGGLSQARQVLELQRDGLDVGQLPALAQSASGGALPVREPIRRGLLGMRLLIARRDRAEAIAASPTLAALQRAFRLGHGEDWGDLPLMRQAGFNIVTSTSYDGLFRMLEAGRFDFMSRAVSEVWDELARPALAGRGQLVVVPRLALFYPLDDFFWVNPARPEIAEAIATGLRRARADGSWGQLYRQQYGEALQRADLARREVWRLPAVEPPIGSEWQQYDVLQQLLAPAATQR